MYLSVHTTVYDEVVAALIKDPILYNNHISQSIVINCPGGKSNESCDIWNNCLNRYVRK